MMKIVSDGLERPANVVVGLLEFVLGDHGAADGNVTGLYFSYSVFLVLYSLPQSIEVRMGWRGGGGGVRN